jgi:hypothetical protein
MSSSSFQDDLYVTNPLIPSSSARINQTQDDTKEYQRLLHAKRVGSTMYPPNVPEFASGRPPANQIKLPISEESPGFDQYVNFSMQDKWKKAKKTLINIDSRNRRVLTYYEKTDIILRRYSEFNKPEFNLPLFFEGNSNVAYMLLETQFTNEIDNQQFAIFNAPTNLFNQIGSDDTNFIFDTYSSKPVFNVDKFIYDPIVDENIDNIGNRESNTNSSYLDQHIVTMPEVYNSAINVRQYKFNVIRFRIESNIDISLIKRGYIGDDSLRIGFITSIRQAYPNPSHYVMNLGKTFTNIYSVRLVSTEIPNTAYTFNNNVYISEFGQMKLRTEVNNKLRWIYKSDLAKQLNYHVMSSDLYKNYTNTESIAIINDYTQENINHYDYIKPLYEIINTDNPQYEENPTLLDIIQRRFSIYQQKNAYMTDDDGVTIKKNTFFDTRYLLELTEDSTTNINSQLGFNLPNTIFTQQELLYSYMKKIFNSHSYYHGRFRYLSNYTSVFSSGKILNNTFASTDNKTMYFFDPYNLRFVVSIHLDRSDRYYTDFVREKIRKNADPNNTSLTLGTDNYPIRIDFRSIQNTDLTKMTVYSVDVISIQFDNDYIYAADPTISTSAYRRNYFFYYVPQGGQYDNSGNMLLASNERVVMTVWNPISTNILQTIQQTNPYLYSVLRTYYLNSYVQNHPVFNKSIYFSAIDDSKSFDSYYYSFRMGPYEVMKMHTLTEIVFQFKTTQAIQNCQFNTFSSANPNPNPGFFTIDTSNSLLYINSANVAANFMDEILPSSPYLVIFPVYFFINVKKSRRFRTSSYDTIILSYYNSNYGVQPYTNTFFVQFPNAIDASNVIQPRFTNGSRYNFEFQIPRWENLQGFYYKYIPMATNQPEVDSFIEDFLFGAIRNQIGILRFTNVATGTNYADSFQSNFNFMDFYITSYELRQRTNNALVCHSTDISFNPTTLMTNRFSYYLYFNASLKKNYNFLSNQEHEFTGVVPSSLYGVIHLYKEVPRIYLRNSIHSYLSLKTENIDTNTQNVILTNVYNGLKFNRSTQLYEYDLSVNTVPYLYDIAQSNNLRHTEFCDMLDFSQFSIIGITKTTYSPGITSTQFANEYIEETNKSSTILYPAISENSPRLFLPFELSSTSENAQISDLVEYTRYPVYQLDIVPSKYTENSLSQYFLNNMGNIKRKYYNYQQEIFTNDNVYQTNANVIYETDYQSECKTIVSIQRATNSIQFKQYRKIFETHDNEKRMYFNQGFPFIYLHIPEISVTNGSLVYIDGASTTQNITASQLNKEHTAYIPRNYRVKVRQLLPLPDISVLQNDQTMFGEVGYVKDAINDLHNSYLNYINKSVETGNVRDPYMEFILEQVIGVNESGYNHHTSDRITSYRQTGYLNERDVFLPPNNEAMVYSTDVRGSYMNPYGKSNAYQYSYGYGNQRISNQTRNRYGLEYISSAWVNAARNGTLWNEYRSAMNLTNTKDLFKSTFAHGECFMKLSDMHKTEKYTNIGRIRHIDPYPDMNGNVELQYDLFTENNTQFTMFDIVVGLDSQTIGIIVPYDYEYAQMPAVDLVLFGLGTYLLHRYASVSNHVAEIIESIDHLLDQRDVLKRKFMRSADEWTIEEDTTQAGFYIRSDTTPNASNAYSPEIRIYIPEFFRFLDTDDSPMKLFGFRNTIYNNQFNYFKDNYTPFQTALINRSYVSYFQNKETFIIFEAKEINDYEINDTIFIEEHRIVQADLNKYKDRFMGVTRMEPMSHFLSRMETIYNTQILNHSGLARPLLLGDQSHDIGMFINDVVRYQKPTSITNTTDYFSDTVYSLIPSTEVKAIPFKNRYITRHFHEEYEHVSRNYNLYYQSVPDTLLLSDSSANTTQIFDISYNLRNGLSVFIGGVDILSDIKRQKVAYHCNFIPTASFEDRYTRRRETMTFYKTERSSVFISTDNYDVVPLQRKMQYTIRVHLYRQPICVSTYDISSIGLVVNRYDTLGIMERYMNHLMTSFVDTYVNDITRAYYFDSRYNPQLFRNRILKFKVCPVDTLGFSYEPASTSGAIYNSSTDMSTRVCKGRSRKLFPYAEYQLANTYDRLSDGEAVVPNSYVYRTYQRPYTTKDNNQASSKLFMPGMGVYAVTESITSRKTGNLPATAYEYNSNFIGYVLGTSISYDQTDYARNYTINSPEFAERDASNAVWSEYEMYVLLDPQIQTRQQVSQLFDLLNQDYTHVVFDADATVDQVINIDGILAGSRRPYSYEYTMDLSGIVTLGNLTNPTIDASEYAYPIPENRLSQCTTWTNNQFYYTENDDWDISNDRIPSANVDGLLGLTASNIVIHRPILSATLPSYSFQKRIACATLVERPVMYTSEGVDPSAVSCLFVTGEYDFFYREYLQGKTVIHYDPIQSKETINYINQHQLAVENSRSNSYHQNNPKEIDSHSGHIDDSLQQSYEFADAMKYQQSDRQYSRDLQEHISFDAGDDVIITGNPNIASDETVKILSGSFTSTVYLDDPRFIQSAWNDQLRNTCVLDIDYFKYGLESLHKSPCMMKKKGYNIDIVGNQFSKFTQDTDSDIYDYNIVLALSYTELTGNAGSIIHLNGLTDYNVSTGTQDIGHIFRQNDFENGWKQYQIQNALLVTFPLINTYVGTYPYNSVDFSELAVIQLAQYDSITDRLSCYLENRLYETFNIITQNSTIQSNVSIPYKTYKTCNTALLDRLYTRNIVDNANTSVSHSLTYGEQSVLLIEMASNMSFTVNDTADNKSNYKIYNDVYINDKCLEDQTTMIIDYGTQRNVEYSSEGTTPFLLDTENSQLRNTTVFTQISRQDSTLYHSDMVDMFVNSAITVNNVSDISSAIHGSQVLRMGYGIYKKHITSAGRTEYHRYVDAEEVNRSYAIADISAVKRVFKCYGVYVNEVDLNEPGYTLPRYKYACLSHPDYRAIDILFSSSMLPVVTADMSGGFALIRSNTTELYRCIGGSWVSQTLSSYHGAVFRIDVSSSFYYNNIYVMDQELNTFVDLYQSEVYRDKVHQTYFLYDKIDAILTVSNTRVIVPEDGQLFRRHMKVMIRTHTTDGFNTTVPNTAKFYYVRGSSGDLSNNFLEEYTIPENTTVKVRYNATLSGSTVSYSASTQTFYYTENRVMRLSPTTLELYTPSQLVQDVLYDMSVDFSGTDLSLNNYYKFITTNTLYGTDVSTNTLVKYVPENTSLVYDYTRTTNSYSLISGSLGPGLSTESEVSFKVRSYLYARYGITYLYSGLLSRFSMFYFYPQFADIAAFDILTEEQVTALEVEAVKYPTLIANNELVLTVECNVYRYNSTTKVFEEYESSLLLGKNIYIYGAFSGNQGKLVRRIANTTPLMTTSQYSADYNVVDLIRIQNDTNYVAEIASNVSRRQYGRYQFILVHRPDAVDESKRYGVYRTDGSGVAQELSDTTLFPIYNRTYFVSNPDSTYRGLTYRLHSGQEMHQVVVALTDQVLPVYYPENTRIVAMSNPLRDRSTAKEIYSNQLSTQPFLSGNQWYTKVFYRGAEANISEFTGKTGNRVKLFSDLTSDNYKEGGEERFGVFESQKLFFSGMKGLRLPYISIQPPQSTTDAYYYGKVSKYSMPFSSDYYTTDNPLSEDYSPYLTSDRNTRKVFGVFQRGNDWDYTDKSYKYYETDEGVQYPYIIVPGFYLGYGGRIQERQDEDIVNSMVNNDNGLKVSRVSRIGGKQYIYTELPVQQSYLFENITQKSLKSVTKIADKTRNRLPDLPYDVQFNYIDRMFQDTNYLNSLISLFGVDGRIVKKRINNPYELNQNQYVFLVIPNLNHIDNIQNTSFTNTDGAFSKILLPGDSNRTVYNTYVASNKVYYDKLFTNLSELEIAFVTNKGTLFDFNGADHSFTLEITEIIDKLEYINSRVGNIEY